MARFKNDDIITNAFQPFLAPREQIKHWAYGVKQPPILLIILLCLLAVLPGAIAVALLTKEYVIGLTDRRLIVLRFSGKLKVKEVLEYNLPRCRRARPLLADSSRTSKSLARNAPFIAKFHRLGMKQNREHAMAIAAAITGAASGDQR
jgi:hypothetical protein